MTVLGLRVLRGPDWRGGDTDGGEGHVGTVIELLGNHMVRVLWDMGQESTCSTGRDGICELRILDSAPAGVRHPGTRCVECGKRNIRGLLWRCQGCPAVDLCSHCYSNDKHELRHHFECIHVPGTTGRHVGTRISTMMCRSVGIFPGSKVVKGNDRQSIPKGSAGEVKGDQNLSLECCRGSVQVEWRIGLTSTCSLGLHGNVDVTCVEEGVGPCYYRDHLPLLQTFVHQHEETIPSSVSSRDSGDSSSNDSTAMIDYFLLPFSGGFGYFKPYGQLQAPSGFQNVTDLARLLVYLRATQYPMGKKGSKSSVVQSLANLSATTLGLLCDISLRSLFGLLSTHELGLTDILAAISKDDNVREQQEKEAEECAVEIEQTLDDRVAENEQEDPKTNINNKKSDKKRKRKISYVSSKCVRLLASNKTVLLNASPNNLRSSGHPHIYSKKIGFSY